MNEAELKSILGDVQAPAADAAFIPPPDGMLQEDELDALLSALEANGVEEADDIEEIEDIEMIEVDD